MPAKLLIVEDHDDFRDVVKKHIQDQDASIEIIEAESGEIGILKAMREKPDIILMDIRLPSINGLDAASRIKQYLPKCKIIILTMFETDSFRKVFKSKDISAYIGKSELFDRLFPVIRELLY